MSKKAKKGIKFYNALASFVDKDTVKIRSSDRVKYEDILQVIYYSISSDDMFSLAKHPGKTLVVGGSYVALESAGLLASLGCEVHLLIRSEPLRFFDKDCVDRVMESLEKYGVKTTYHKIVQKVESEADLKKVQCFYIIPHIVNYCHPSMYIRRIYKYQCYETIWYCSHSPRMLWINFQFFALLILTLYKRFS
uniref:Pyr_redox domain-containing protein n=1 Tax=Heterorhabditis bacteriophora TaxID=37862 RepID=A0A1I7X4V4_HETBA